MSLFSTTDITPKRACADVKEVKAFVEEVGKDLCRVTVDWAPRGGGWAIYLKVPDGKLWLEDTEQRPGFALIHAQRWAKQLGVEVELSETWLKTQRTYRA